MREDEPMGIQIMGVPILVVAAVLSGNGRGRICRGGVGLFPPVSLMLVECSGLPKPLKEDRNARRQVRPSGARIFASRETILLLVVVRSHRYQLDVGNFVHGLNHARNCL